MLLITDSENPTRNKPDIRFDEPQTNKEPGVYYNVA